MTVEAYLHYLAEAYAPALCTLQYSWQVLQNYIHCNCHMLYSSSLKVSLRVAVDMAGMLL